ncbi:MAG: carboxypeptidase-like regulatory domain-containing protein [Saprospiraceae bacterium]|nr:carboxypeptidase-like regulatory domain-containing protein [Saprospiraceae bacterium]
MKANYLILYLVCNFTVTLIGQQTYEIEGRVNHMGTNEPIPFATIYNKSLKIGTISNTDGYFRISINGYRDTVRISFIGFKDQIINLKGGVSFYLINLEENFHMLKEITVTPKDNSYLFQLLQECRKKSSPVDITAKSYYELKSFINNKQIEFVEGYYNADIKSYQLSGLHFKTGRIALQPYEDRFFVSLESSRAILLLDLFKGNEQFPLNPLELSKSKLRKNFTLSLDNTFLDGEADSIYVIEYFPKDTTGRFFEGKIWINKTKKQFMKITLNCRNALKHPFLPLFPSDKVANVCFNITQSYISVNDQSYFNHIDFVYKFDYHSRMGNTEEQTYSIVTNTVLHTYDYNDVFILPVFDYSFQYMDDYRKVNAIPYNEFFWNYNNEYRLNDSLNKNEHFFKDSNSINNKALFKSNSFMKLGLLEHPYVEWSKARIKLREILPDSVENELFKNLRSEQFKLSVKIFLDVNSYKDSTNVITSTIFDPYHSYYYLPMDQTTQCFINIYFDLYEIRRRALIEKLKTVKNDIYLLRKIFIAEITEFEIEMRIYLEAVQRGTIVAELKKYNDFVFNNLGIDNIEFFQLFKK